MTCVAWDGTTLAADKRATRGEITDTVTKIFRVNDLLVGFCGTGSLGHEMVEWLRRGGDPDTFPERQRDEDKCAGVLAITRTGEVRHYGAGPHPDVFENKHVSLGSGRDYARAAMHLGKTAAEAVAVACEFDPGCGNGIDTLTF